MKLGGKTRLKYGEKFQKFKIDFQGQFSLSRTVLVNIFSRAVCLSQLPLKMCLEAVALPDPLLENQFQWKTVYRGGCWLIETTSKNKFSRAVLLLQLLLIIPFLGADILMEPPLKILLQGRLNARRYKLGIFTTDGIVAVLWTIAENCFWPLVKIFSVLVDRQWN